MSGRIITLSPSAFGFLYEECAACYYNEALGIRKRPRTPFPAVFTAIDIAMKRHFESRPWHRIGAVDERFRIVAQGRWVKSKPIPIPITGSDVSLVIRGVYDSQIAFESGERAICDFKTSPIRPELVPKYARQLHAYAWAVERPADGIPDTIPRLGLAVFEPRAFSSQETNKATLAGDLAWLEICRDDASFAVFLDGVGRMLAGAPPKPNSSCAFCSFREVA